MSQPFVNISNPLAELAASHTVITPNERLAREFKLAFDQHQQSVGKQVWPTLDCLSLQRFLLSQLQRYEDQCDEALPTLLSQHTLRQAAWQTAPAPSLNQVDAFCGAWQMIHRYDIDLQSPAFATPQGALFNRWFTAVQATLPDNLLVAETLGDYLVETGVLPELPILLIDFEQFTKVEQRYLNFVSAKHRVLLANGSAQEIVPWPHKSQAQAGQPSEDTPTAGTPELAAYESLNAELAAAASWARDVKQHAPTATIGIVVPNLAQNYARVQRQVAAVLDPVHGSLSQVFDLSAGLALAEQPVWQHALMMLNACRDGFTPQVCLDLASSRFLDLSSMLPLVDHWPRQWSANVPLQQIFGAIDQGDKLDFDTTGKQSFGAWLIRCRALLECCGWPQSQQLSSVQFQAYASLEDAFDLYLTDSLPDTVTFAHMLRLLNSTLSAQIFAPQRPHADVLVLGALETTGLSFSHLWVCGLDENSFPNKNVAHPFIPRSVAQAAGVPRSSQLDELTFAQQRLLQWQQLAGRLVISYSLHADNNEQLPSPLVSAYPPMNPLLEIDISGFAGTTSERLSLESIADDHGPALPAGEVKGGTGLLRAQALCPFKAFAQYRLGLTQPNEITIFPDALARGNLLHDTLFDLVRRNSTQELLATLSTSAVKQACQRTLAKYPRLLPELFIQHEIERLSTLILKWLAVEARRQPFEAVYLEETFTLTLDSFAFAIRVDRVDRIDGGLVVIDYKTGLVSLAGMTTSPINDPQLPAYSLIDPEIVGVYFAELRDSARLLGVADEVGKIDGAQFPRSTDTWATHKSRWQQDLAALAASYAAGSAVVEPLTGACRYCHLADLCRIEDNLDP